MCDTSSIVLSSGGVEYGLDGNWLRVRSGRRGKGKRTLLLALSTGDLAS